MLREAKTTKQVVDLAGRIAALCRDDAMLVLRSDRVGRVEALPGWWRHDERRYGEMVIGLFRLEHGA